MVIENSLGNAPKMPTSPEDWGMYLLEKVKEVTPEKKESFRKKVLPKFQKTFENMSEDGQTVLVSLDLLTDAEINAIRKLPIDFFFGLHDVKNRISTSLMLTGRVKRVREV